MNLLAMTQRLYRETGRSGDGPTTLVGATKIVQRLADSLSDSWDALQNEPGNWKWMRAGAEGVTTPGVVGHSAADLGLTSFLRWRPVDTGYTVKAFDANIPTDVWRLRWLPTDEFKRRVVDASMAAGRPLYWSIDHSDDLMVGPVGDIPYTLRFEYVTAPTTLSLDADAPNMPDRHHMLLVWRALIDGGKSMAAPETVSRAMDRWAEMRRTLIADQAEQITLAVPPLC